MKRLIKKSEEEYVPKKHSLVELKIVKLKTKVPYSFFFFFLIFSLLVIFKWLECIFRQLAWKR